MVGGARRVARVEAGGRVRRDQLAPVDRDAHDRSRRSRGCAASASSRTAGSALSSSVAVGDAARQACRAGTGPSSSARSWARTSARAGRRRRPAPTRGCGAERARRPFGAAAGGQRQHRPGQQPERRRSARMPSPRASRRREPSGGAVSERRPRLSLAPEALCSVVSSTACTLCAERSLRAPALVDAQQHGDRARALGRGRAAREQQRRRRCWWWWCAATRRRAACRPAGRGPG